jgi:uncharacterized protein
MNSSLQTVRAFYAALENGDVRRALDCMADDIEWIAMWHYQVKGRGPQYVAEGLIEPLIAEWTTFRIAPTEFISEGDSVVSLGRFVGTHAVTGKRADARYAHVWTVSNGKIQRFRQYIDTLEVANARLTS